MSLFEKTIKCNSLTLRVIKEIKTSLAMEKSADALYISNFEKNPKLVAEVSIGQIAERIMSKDTIFPNRINSCIIYHYFHGCDSGCK